MSKNPLFWSRLKSILFSLFAVCVLATAYFYLTMEGWRQLFFASSAGVLAVNVLLAYILVRVNDKKRPRG